MNTYWTSILSRHTCLAIQYRSSSVLNLSIFTPSHATLSSEVILSMAPSSITIHRKMTHIFVSSDKHSALKFGPMHLAASLTTAWCFPDISIKLSSKELLRLSLPSILFNEPRSHPVFSVSADDISIYFVPWARNPAVIRYLRKSQPPLSGQSTVRSPHSSLVSSVAGITLVLDRCLFPNWPLRFHFSLPHPAIVWSFLTTDLIIVCHCMKYFPSIAFLVE